MANITYPLLFLFAIAPSIIWLIYFLRKDSHPEPNYLIVRVFLLGALATFPAIPIEIFLQNIFSNFNLSNTISLLLYFIIGVALIEELLKYIAVRIGVLKNPALNEPIDAMLYMVVAALGFAALENVFLLFGLIETYPISDIFLVNGVRLIEAVFLHALASALLGYFLALVIFQKKHRKILFFIGLGLATLLHGLFNFYIVTVGGQNLIWLLAPVIPLVIIGTIVSFEFRRLKTLWNKKSL